MTRLKNVYLRCQNVYRAICNSNQKYTQKTCPKTHVQRMTSTPQNVYLLRYSVYAAMCKSNRMYTHHEKSEYESILRKRAENARKIVCLRRRKTYTFGYRAYTRKAVPWRKSILVKRRRHRKTYTFGYRAYTRKAVPWRESILVKRRLGL